MAHEDMLTKLDAAFQTGDAPDIYMERGGGELAAPRRGRPGEGHLRGRRRHDREDRRLRRRLAGRRHDLRAAVLGRRRRLLVQHGALRAGRHHRAARRRWTTSTTRSTSSRPPASSRSRSGAGDKWPAAHYWYYFALRECSEDVLRGRRVAGDFSDECFVKAGEDLEELVAAEPFNAGLPGHPGADRPDQRLRPARHRQGRDGARRSLGARRHAGPDRGREGPRREHRLVPVPDRRGRRGRPGRRDGRRRRVGLLGRGPRRVRRLHQLPAHRRGPDRLRGARHGPADQPRRDRLRRRPGAGRAAHDP